MPRAHGVGFVHISEITALVENHHPLPDLPITEVDETSKKIGGYIAEMIPDGSTVQFGIGTIGDSVAYALQDKKDLGVYSELITDSVRVLWEKGVITNRRKNFMKYISVGSFAFGSQKLYNWIDNNPSIQFYPSSWVNDPHNIAKNDNMISINSALSVDIFGQVNAEAFGPIQYGGIGGNLDFTEGAWRSKGGKSFMALPSTAKNDTVSRIVFQHPVGQVITTGRSDIHYLVTEFGVVLLKGQSVKERVKRIISIAHPKFREELTFQAKKLNLII
jgi:acyl-CoA hydrolase